MDEIADMTNSAIHTPIRAGDFIHSQALNYSAANQLYIYNFSLIKRHGFRKCHKAIQGRAALVLTWHFQNLLGLKTEKESY